MNLSLLRIGTTLLVLVTAAAACSDPEDSALADDAPAATVLVAAPPPVSAQATTSTTSTFGELIDDCVQYTQFAAFTGDPEMTAFWDEADQNVGQLELQCTDLAGTDPTLLVKMSTRRAEAEAYLAGAMETTLAP